MKRFQELMDEVKVESYKDCVWYLEDADKCKMADAHGVNFTCHCKEDMDDFCTWVTKFFNLKIGDGLDNEDVSIAEPYLSLDGIDKDDRSLFETIMDALK